MGKPEETGDATIVMDAYDSAEVLAITKTGVNKEWVLYLGCSFHMCPNKTWFETLEESDHEIILLGNNKGCKVMGIGIVRIQMIDGMERIL